MLKKSIFKCKNLKKKSKISTSPNNILILTSEQHSKNIFRDFLPENFSNCSRKKLHSVFMLKKSIFQFLCIFEILYMFFSEVDTGQRV